MSPANAATRPNTSGSRPVAAGSPPPAGSRGIGRSTLRGRGPTVPGPHPRSVDGRDSPCSGRHLRQLPLRVRLPPSQRHPRLRGNPRWLHPFRTEQSTLRFGPCSREQGEAGRRRTTHSTTETRRSRQSPTNRPHPARAKRKVNTDTSSSSPMSTSSASRGAASLGDIR